MRGLILGINIFNFLVVASLVLYFVIVYLQFVFPFSDLPDGNVPYYVDDVGADVGEFGSERFGLYWWVYGTSTLRLFIPLLAISAPLLVKYNASGFTPFILIFILIFVLWEFVRFFWNLFLYAPGNCSQHQFCRNYDARRAGGLEVGADPDIVNFPYQFETFYAIGFFLITIVYLALVSAVDGTYLLWNRRGTGTAGRPKTAPRGWIVWLSFIFNVIFALALAFFLVLTFQNFVFTFMNLPDDQVPFYIMNVLADPTELNSGRLELYWWIYATDALLLFVPPLVIGNLSAKAYGGSGFTLLLQMIVALLLVFQVVKFVWAGALALGASCEGHQFCRNFGARRDGGGNEVGANPGVMNFVYATYAWFQLGFILALFLDFLLVSSLRGAMFSTTVGRLVPIGKRRVKQFLKARQMR